ncbi:unnamed protein product [Ixodes pacificus]
MAARIAVEVRLGKFAVNALLNRGCTRSTVLHLWKRQYARKAAAAAASGGLALQTQKKKLPVETDPEKLTTLCCGSNILREGSDVPLGPDSDYPDWLWELRIDGRVKLEDLDPSTAEYWEFLHHEALIHQNKLRSKAPKPELRINEKDKLKKLRAIMFRALAGYHYDPGVPVGKALQDRKRNKLEFL